MKNIPVIITKNEQIAPRCFRLILSGSLNDVLIKPGQFIMLKVGTDYDPLLRRPFAALRSKTGTDLSLEVYYQVVGRGTQLMSSLVPGTTLEVLGPLGNGFTIPPAMKHAVLIAGGMGIVPVRCLIHSLLAKSKPAALTLLYGAQTASDLLFVKEFDAMGITVQISTDDGSRGDHGLVTGAVERLLHHLRSDYNEAACFACGPWPMLRAVAEITALLQIPCQVSLETRMACGVGACLGCVVKQSFTTLTHGSPPDYTRVCLEGPVFEAQEIEW